MKQFIYISAFPASPEATPKQQMHFATDVSHAILERYDFIKSSDNMTFQILDDNELIEVGNLTEEDLQTGYLNQLAQQDDEDCDDCDDEGYCIQCHNIRLIDEVINNTLSKQSDITPQQAGTMKMLAELKLLLLQGAQHGL